MGCRDTRQKKNTWRTQKKTDRPSSAVNFDRHVERKESGKNNFILFVFVSWAQYNRKGDNKFLIFEGLEWSANEPHGY